MQTRPTPSPFVLHGATADGRPWRAEYNETRGSWWLEHDGIALGWSGDGPGPSSGEAACREALAWRMRHPLHSWFDPVADSSR
jgi:hypothetical protein